MTLPKMPEYLCLHDVQSLRAMANEAKARGGYSATGSRRNHGKLFICQVLNDYEVV